MKKNMFNKKLIIGALVSIPMLVILTVILCRYLITPSNEYIIDQLKNTKCYSSKVEYIFKNSKSEFRENTIQYYNFDRGARIEFKDGYNRVKVYNGSEIKVDGSEDEQYILNKGIDIIYPLAFIENILSNQQCSQVKEVKAEWSQETYLQVDIEYKSNNKYLYKAEFYIDKNKRIPVLLKILDESNKERVIITYKDFVKEKSLNDNLF